MSNNKIDFAIITALQIELDAVLSKLDTKAVAEKPLIFHHGNLGNAKVVVTCSGERNINAADAAATVLERYHPTYLLMVGIAAGFESAGVNLGDVVIAKACYYDGPGKETPAGKEPEHDQIPTSQELCAFSQNYQKLDWKANIRVPSPANSFQPSVHYGRIASSETVIANKQIMASLLAKHRKLRALAQEGYGVAKVAYGRNIDFLEIRGICDFGTEEKNDKWHDYAADVAAAYAVGLLRYIEVTYISKPDTSPVSTTVPDKVDISRLPRPATPLIGRQTELQQMQQAFLTPNTVLTILVAAGGIGKSALSDAWLKQMQPHYHGVQRVFAWSFYSQGSHNTQTSATPFFQEALPFFGWTGEIPKDDVAKGRALAKLLRQQAFLLILDGLEPLQHPTQILDGELKDTALKALLEEVRLYGLAKQPSLILLSSRQPLMELQEWEAERYVTLDVQTLPVADGVEVLKQLKVQGTEKELAQASEEMGGHALALVLLGKLLKEKFAGRIERRDQLPKLWEARQQGGHALRVLQFYAERYWQPETPELAFVQLLGLFDRPMTLREKEVLVTQADCAEPLRALDDVGWELLERHLEAAGLLLPSPPGRGAGGEGDRYHWDCHPLIRDYFGSRFQATQPDRFRQAHHVLFEYYQAVPTQRQPTTLAELEPLYRAVVHGCLAEEYEKSEKVYDVRIRHHSLDKFGAYSQNLTALAAFFPHGWSQPVQQGLTEVAQAFLLAGASFCLMSLGRLKEAVESRVAHLNLSEKLIGKCREEGEQEENLENIESICRARANFPLYWNEFFMATQNLTDLYLLLGQLSDAEKIAHQAIEQYKRDKRLDRFVEIKNHFYYATVLHRQGKLNQALQLFQEAEQVIQEKEVREGVGWHSFYLFLYCPLLLDLAQSVTEYETILEKVGKLFFRVARSAVTSIWFDCLTYARVFSRLQYDENADYLFDQAVDGIRNAGNIDLLPEFLIDRANFHLRSSRLNLDTAAHDLQEADSVIRRSGMKLYAVDSQLAWCRYYLKQAELGKARTCLERARELIAVTGYRLREREVGEVGKAGGW